MSSEEELDETALDDQSRSVCMPYLYEPLVKDQQCLAENACCFSGDSESDSPADDQSMDTVCDDTNPTVWCVCNHCQQMATSIENVCCRAYDKIRHMIPDDCSCICETVTFKDNCLNKNVLETSRHEYVERNGPFGDDEPINEVYRYLAYRRFCYTVWHRLGRRMRKVLPACVVTEIRKQFPSDHFTGFKSQ